MDIKYTASVDSMGLTLKTLRELADELIDMPEDAAVKIYNPGGGSKINVTVTWYEKTGESKE